MGKKKTGGNLGKSLIKDRFGSSRNRKRNGESCLHTSELSDGYEWGRLNLQSVTEESSFQEFLSTAELAGTEFLAEKMNIKFVPPKSQIGLLTETEKKNILASQEKNKSLLKIPRRPKWSSETTAEELQAAEKESFLIWRRQLAALQEDENILLTPYEKNLEFWRQLWRVIERSDVVVQIVDARNPLLFRCEDLESYVKEIDSNKLNMILLNKADFLTTEQRQAWADYFAKQGVKVAFFSAILSAESIKEEQKEDKEINNIKENKKEIEYSDTEEGSSDRSSLSSYKSTIDSDNFKLIIQTDSESINETKIPKETSKIDDGSEETSDKLVQMKIQSEDVDESKINLPVDIEKLHTTLPVQNSSELLSRKELIDFFKTVYNGKTYTNNVTTIGLVGYPNVGKSSTINSLMMSKKVSVSATPGKTKHFQTLYLDKDLMLCDCPGLVMPSFISTKSEMILNGILPIDQMKDHVPPINLLGTLIPRHVIQDTYGIMLPLPMDGEDPDRPPYSEEILNSYAYNRGFMTQNGQPDNPRSSRYLLKDFVNGRLLYCVAPPGTLQDTYHKFPPRCRAAPRHVPPATLRATRGSSVINGGDIDKSFFSQRHGFHFKGKVSLPATSEKSDEKPWKKFNKHANKNKREKLRRLHRDLDLH